MRRPMRLAWMFSVALSGLVLASTVMASTGDDRNKKPATSRAQSATSAKKPSAVVDKQAVASEATETDMLPGSAITGSDPEMVQLRREADAKVAARPRANSVSHNKTTPSLAKPQ